MSRIDGGSLLFVLCALGASGARLLATRACFASTPSSRAPDSPCWSSDSRSRRGVSVARRGRSSSTRSNEVESIDLEIETASVATGWDLRDAFLRSEVMFDVGRFPGCNSIRRDSLRRRAAQRRRRRGHVARRDAAGAASTSCASNAGRRPEDGRETCGAEVVGRISRAAFGMDFGYPLIGDDVELEIVVNAFRVRDVDEIKRSLSGQPSAAFA